MGVECLNGYMNAQCEMALASTAFSRSAHRRSSLWCHHPHALACIYMAVVQDPSDTTLRLVFSRCGGSSPLTPSNFRPAGSAVRHAAWRTHRGGTCAFVHTRRNIRHVAGGRVARTSATQGALGGMEDDVFEVLLWCLVM